MICFAYITVTTEKGTTGRLVNKRPVSDHQWCQIPNVKEVLDSIDRPTLVILRCEEFHIGEGEAHNATMKELTEIRAMSVNTMLKGVRRDTRSERVLIFHPSPQNKALTQKM